MCLYSFFILILLYDNPVSAVRAWGPVGSGCSQRQLSYQMSIFRSSLIVTRVWLSSGHGRAQPPPGLTQGMPCLPWKLSCPDRTAMPKARWDIRSSSATLLEHGEVFCISAENRKFPLMQYAGSLLGKTEMRGEGGCHWMLRKWQNIKKSVITLTKQILFGGNNSD